MSNPVKGEVPLTLGDGQQFTLVFDFEALVEAETAYGKPLRQLWADAAQEFVGAIRALLYGALRAKHPQVTLREAGTMLGSDLEAITAALEGAAAAGFEQPEVSEGGDSPNPPGKRSGRSGAKRG